MKIAVAAVLVVAIACDRGRVGLCVSSGKSQGRVTMAVFDDVWLTTVRDSMIAWAGRKTDIDLTIVDARTTPTGKSDSREFSRQGMDAIVILPVDTAPRTYDQIRRRGKAAFGVCESAGLTIWPMECCTADPIH